MKDQDKQIVTISKHNSILVSKESNLAQVEETFVVESPKICSLYVQSTKISKDTCIEIYAHASDSYKGKIHWVYSFTGSNGFFYESQEPEGRAWIKIMLEPKEVGLQEGDEIQFSVCVCNLSGECDTHELKFTIIDPLVDF